MEDYAPFNQEQFDLWLSAQGDSTLRLNYDLNENSIVFDLGGFKGDWATKILQKYRSKIYIFEPVNEFYNSIASRFNGNPKIQSFKFGLGGKDEEMEISLTKDSSSVFNSDGKKEKIQIKSLVDFLRNNNIERVDLIKINIEGGEYDLLEDLVKHNMLNVFDNIQVQFHRFIPECIERRNKIREALSESHHITYDYEFVWENWKLKK